MSHEHADESHQPGSPGHGLSTTRVEALSDGVFAVAFTLLVLGITVRLDFTGSPDAIEHQLEKALRGEWQAVAGYVVTFVIIGVYYVGHHNQFYYVRRADRTSMWINILFLMTVAFLPFSAGLVEHYGRERIAVIVYGGNLIATGMMLYTHWWYATTHHRLVSSTLEKHIIQDVKTRVLIAPTACLVAIASSFLRPEISLVIYALLPVYYILPGHIDMHLRRSHEHLPDEMEMPVAQPSGRAIPSDLSALKGRNTDGDA